MQGVFCLSRVSEVIWGGGFMLNLERKSVLDTHPQQELVEDLAKIPLGFIHHMKSIISDSDSISNIG